MTKRLDKTTKNLCAGLYETQQGTTINRQCMNEHPTNKQQGTNKQGTNNRQDMPHNNKIQQSTDNA